ncbi:hypothetical protein C8P64_0147 [Christiangramia gaetbulicola]|uniref:Uncharacterized protein n=2 Tax=Christiangramia gaetbulicola TaxID=703340 RepID=A0A2T6AK64_9FLAO|nr:hypothetical protein C8P64_0147 [Christiangramia gaetbulicola]
MSVFVLWSCSQDDTQIEPEESLTVYRDKEIVDDKLYFSSRESLDDFINEKSESEFQKAANSFRKKGFKPLAPMFTEDEAQKKTEFLQKKKERLLKKSDLYTSKNHENAEVDVDDELIMDPRFAALLNEGREIIVGDTIYVYTQKGLFYSDLSHESNLRDYLAKKNKASLEKREEIIDVCGTGEVEPYVFQHSDCDGGGGGGGGGTPPAPSYDDFPLDIKRSLGVCVVDDTSLWQQVFGQAETCHDYFADDRRAKVKFWNQNYFIFSSIGAQVKHQKKNFFIWDSSDATDYIEMGLTNVSFKYNFPTAVYGEIFRNISSGVIITWKGKTYTADGRVINGYPLQASNLPFDVQDNDAISVYLFNEDINIIDEQQANNIIRDAARNFISTYGSSLETPISNTSDDLGIHGVIIDPLSNGATFTIVGQIIRQQNASSITKIFDFNVLVGFNLKLSGGSYSVGPKGDAMVYNSGASVEYESVMATSYTDVTLDMYGVVRRNGDEYRGRRVISENLE